MNLSFCFTKNLFFFLHEFFHRCGTDYGQLFETDYKAFILLKFMGNYSITGHLILTVLQILLSVSPPISEILPTSPKQMFGQILNQMDGSNNWRKQNKKTPKHPTMTTSLKSV